MAEITTVQLIIITAIFGLLIGSFISMLTWRLPRIMELAAEQQFKQISVARSSCPNCKKTLNWYQLFPLFSWLFAKGRCKKCHTKISIRYPLIELTTMLLTVYIILTFQLTGIGFFALIFTYFLITITIIDIEHQLILDKLSLPLMWLGLLINTQSIFSSLEHAVIGAAAGYMLLWTLFYVFKAITGKEAMGFGDFKLLAALGAWFGFMAIPQIILIAAVSSIIIAVLLSIMKIKAINTAIPFGPFLALAGMVTLVFGTQII